MPISFSRVASIEPKLLTKHFERAPDGRIVKSTFAQLTKGCLAPFKVHDLRSFGDVIVDLKPNEALIYGVPLAWRVTNIVTQRMLDAFPDTDAIARTNRHLRWSEEPGIFVIDYDPPKDGPALTKAQLVDALIDAVPELAQTPLLYYTSASSHICETGGADLTGLRGQRIYIAVAQASDVPRLGEQINLRLWASGNGRIEISKSGSLLRRTLVDSSIWQPSRLDFAAGASVGPGLEQRRGAPELILPVGCDPDGPLAYFDSREILPDAGPELVAEAAAALRAAEEERRPAARARRRAYVRERLEERNGAQDRGDGESENTILQAIESAVLGPDFVLHVHADEAPDRRKQVTVAEVLADPDTYDGRTACDPVEPEYNEWSRVAKLFLRGPTANLYSLAHGGRNYTLSIGKTTITLALGGTSKAVKETLDAMQVSGHYMNLGDALVTVDSPRPTLVNEYSLAYRLGQFADFRKIKTVRGMEIEEPIDPPDRLCRQILHIGKSDRPLPSLMGIARGPFIRPSGTLCTRPGFDAETGVYGFFSEADFPFVPENPTLEECVAAHELIWSPFLELKLDSPGSMTALLCALLTAPIRQVIDKSPVFASLAPDHGSGKTLVTEAIGALAMGARPPIMPPLDGASEDEMRKRLTACLLPPAEPVLVLDNLEGYLDSRVLASFATAPFWSDRILGVSRMETELPNRALVLMSGKSLFFKEELARRILSWTIEASRQGPYDNTFSFCPVERMLERRAEIVCAVLTLIRAAHLAGNSSPLTMPSYPHWDRLVRQTVLWLNVTVAEGAYVDPLSLIRVATETSSERFEAYELLHALHTWSDGAAFRAAEVAAAVSAGNLELQVQFNGLTGRRTSELSARSIGRYLRTLIGRPFHDLTLTSSSRANMCEWQIKVAPAKDAPETGTQ